MSVIYTSIPNCRDCYKCVRHCPVKAIKIQNGHAEIVDERCIHDGICVDECPQRAIRVESSIEKVKSFIESGDKVIASLSPFFDTKFNFDSPSQIAEGLIRLGFSGVEETITAVLHVVKYYNSFLSNVNSHAISSTCPAIVNLVEKYYPDKIGYLSPVISPSITHARILKALHEARNKDKVRIVHVGSCIAMKSEVNSDEIGNQFDAALTFDELRRWWKNGGIKIENLELSALGNGYHIIDSQNILSTIRQESDKLAAKRIRIPELSSSIEFLNTFPNYMRNMQLAHLKGCTEYCPNGLFIATGTNIAKTGRPIICYSEDAYSADSKGETFYYGLTSDLSREFKTKEISMLMPSEEEIAEILAHIGMFTRRDELDCGACGYDTCREKAIAVYQGMAEIEMCMPYMRRQAAHATSIIEHSLNAIVLVDGDGKIKFTNPGFRSMFRCEGELLVGKPIEEFIHSDCFERALHNRGFWAEKGAIPEYDLNYRIQTFPVREENFEDTINSKSISSTHQLLGGVIVNISEEERSRREFERVKQETLQRAQEVIMRQMHTAQEIAGLLGETTADTKVLLTEVVNLVKKEELDSS
ncbi:4Fe-4S binding protein [bacterium]|nr:4Fe-4S binding protein [bacterium]